MDLALLKANVNAFGKLSAMLDQLIRKQKISFADLDSELKMVEEIVASLIKEKTMVQGLCPTVNVDCQVTALKGYVLPEMERCKVFTLGILKDHSPS